MNICFFTIFEREDVDKVAWEDRVGWQVAWGIKRQRWFGQELPLRLIGPIRDTCLNTSAPGGASVCLTVESLRPESVHRKHWVRDPAAASCSQKGRCPNFVVKEEELR